MPMQKLPDWKPRLWSFLAETANVPFSESATDGFDCGAFAGGAVEAMTGENPHAAVAGKYKTTKGAMRALKRLGHADHVAYAASVLTEIDPRTALFGDVAVVDSPDGPALGVVIGPHIEVRAPSGRAVLPLTDAVRAFRV